MVDRSDFGKRLRTLRQERGMSQAQLAGEEMSAGYLSRLESGARPPTPKIISYLAERLDVSPSAFDAPPVADEAPVADLVRAVTATPDGDGRVDELLERLTRHQAELSLPLRWMALWSLAGIRSEGATHEAQLPLGQELLRTAEESGIPELRVRSLVLVSRIHRSLGDMKAANACADDAYSTAIEHDVPRADTVRALMMLISTEAEASQLHDALRYVADLEVLSKDTTRTMRVEALWTAASVYVRQGNHTAAAARLAEALAMSSSADDLRLWVRLRFAAASLYLQMHPCRLSDAQQILKEVEPALALVGDAGQRLEFRTIRAHAHFQAGELDAARALCEEIRPDAKKLEFRDMIRFEVLVHLLDIISGQVEAGVRAIEALAGKAHEASNMDLAAEIWKNLAETLAFVQSAKSGPGAVDS
ncbi:helix-turn-helix domain-containing protein [Streptomyces sp. NPDC002491]